MTGDPVNEMMRRELETWDRIATLIENQNKLLSSLIGEKKSQNEHLNDIVEALTDANGGEAK